MGKDEVICSNCHRKCRSEACYKRHVTPKTIKGRDCNKSMCEKFYQCETCKKVLEREKRAPELHRCGEWKCKNCFEYQHGEHTCVINVNQFLIRLRKNRENIFSKTLKRRRMKKCPVMKVFYSTIRVKNNALQQKGVENVESARIAMRFDVGMITNVPMGTYLSTM